MTVMLAMISLVGFSVDANAQRRNRVERNRNTQYRVNYRDANNVIKRIENKADRFKRALDRDLDRSRIDGTNREDNINEFVSQFEQATNQLRSNYRDDDRGSNAVREVLQRGKVIDNALSRMRGSTTAKREWNSLRGDLDQLARLYSVSWNWGR